MLTKIEAALTPARRKWAYRVAWAILALLGTYRVIDGDQAGVWAWLASALLGMADAHTDTATPPRQPDVDDHDAE